MTFDDEWAQLKADAQDRHSAQMRLNTAGPQADGAASGGNADLVVHQDDLGAVGNEAFRIHGELRKRADLAGAGADKDGAGTTARAAAELHGRNFSAGGELYTTLEVWSSQVKTVLQMCAHISNHLDFSKKLHANDEVEIAASLSRRDGSPVPVSELLKYVK
ncbi:hypothetical protein OOK13_12550 [Streptomyces sp. NBC_00378]|uniref:AG1 protein n=1 Tax=Streptomyces sanglieri TaxID=193460 RepID=A0ABW2WZE2_9ACTN|nr:MULTISPECIES: hypothetical protein [unclassified Streptomyces]MCX5109347.1 hypothetical protein [Streptomyces sp. NBC_00378]MDV9197626.1 hypothetical protein [Streptomyces sp. Wh19]